MTNRNAIVAYVNAARAANRAALLYRRLGHSDRARQSLLRRDDCTSAARQLRADRTS